jgi:phage gpG-like protein
MAIRETDRGWDRIVREVKAARSTSIAVGIQGDAASQRHDESDLTTAEIGAIHEHGHAGGDGPAIPARSFLRSTVDANEAKYQKLMRGVGDAVIAGKIDVDTGLDLVGEVIVGDVKQAIADGIPPPNAESTIRRKGSATPLLNKGQLRNAITSEKREG